MTSTAPDHAKKPGPVPDVPVRVLTAGAVYDGHDAGLNLVRTLLPGCGAEVVHLGHNRSAREIVRAALQEDVDAIAASSYQGGHLGFFRALMAQLEAADAREIRVFCGGGATISAGEARTLESIGLERVYLPGDGLALGPEGMVRDLIERAARGCPVAPAAQAAGASAGDRGLGRVLTRIETGSGLFRVDSTPVPCPVIGITGPGGAGKSTLMDELLRRLLDAAPSRRVAVLAIDPSRSRTGGALLGDRIRVNSAGHERVFFRSLGTRGRALSSGSALSTCVEFLKRRDFDLVFVETPGIGQGESNVAGICDLTIYVMSPDYGSAGQLEKIDMLDRADLVALTRSDRPGASDALTEITAQWHINHAAGADDGGEGVPVFPVNPTRFDDPGVDRMFLALGRRLGSVLPLDRWGYREGMTGIPEADEGPIPHSRCDYLARIAARGRETDREVSVQCAAAARAQACHRALAALDDPRLPAELDPFPDDEWSGGSRHGDLSGLKALRRAYQDALDGLSRESRALLKRWPRIRREYGADGNSGKDVSGEHHETTLSGVQVPRIALPDGRDAAELLRFLLKEHLPGHFPYTAGVHRFRRRGEEPTRMFAGEGSPEQTNRRFHYLVRGQSSRRLSTAFDPVTLYGEDPSGEPDRLACVGMSGVSVATVDDMKCLYSGIDLCDPRTSVSMTINGPAPAVLAMFLEAATDQRIEKYLHASGGWQRVRRLRRHLWPEGAPRYGAPRPHGHDGLGLGLLGLSGAEVVEPGTWEAIRADTLRSLRGTLQADILKEDQAQNECIFSLPFSLRLMGDVQEYLVASGASGFYGVSVSGYHIAEAGADPVTQLAFTLANGFTLLEICLARGMRIDDIAPRISFFFSNGMDPEYAVIGRVARRIWSRALRDVYGASAAGRRLKYHVQTSGRSLQAVDVDFNDIRSTLEALYATLDNCNSLHTNAFDEAVTTPTEASVRRALAIQMILCREHGLRLAENFLQGSYWVREMTDRVEAAVYDEFDRLSQRGGVLGAMDRRYQRTRIQNASLAWERGRSDGTIPVVGVNTFRAGSAAATRYPVSRVGTTPGGQWRRVRTVKAFREHHRREGAVTLARLESCARRGRNVFEVLPQAARRCSLGQITEAFYRAGGRYRRRI